MSLQSPTTGILDARKLLCPMPVIKTQNKIKTMRAGETLLVIASDPGVKQDIPSWCRINGHHVMETYADSTDICIVIKIGSYS